VIQSRARHRVSQETAAPPNKKEEQLASQGRAHPRPPPSTLHRKRHPHTLPAASMPTAWPGDAPSATPSTPSNTLPAPSCTCPRSPATIRAVRARWRRVPRGEAGVGSGWRGGCSPAAPTPADGAEHAGAPLVDRTPANPTPLVTPVIRTWGAITPGGHHGRPNSNMGRRVAMNCRDAAVYSTPAAVGRKDTLVASTQVLLARGGS
jgi:hypothetical protein